jgi:hypothetical protein
MQTLGFRIFSATSEQKYSTGYGEEVMAKLGLSDWANVAEIGAATGIVISLIFVGLELRSSFMGNT